MCSLLDHCLWRRPTRGPNGTGIHRVSFLRKQESMLDSLHTSLDSRLRWNDMNNYANLRN